MSLVGTFQLLLHTPSGFRVCNLCQLRHILVLQRTTRSRSHLTRYNTKIYKVNRPSKTRTYIYPLYAASILSNYMIGLSNNTFYFISRVQLRTITIFKNTIYASKHILSTLRLSCSSIKLIMFLNMVELEGLEPPTCRVKTG